MNKFNVLLVKPLDYFFDSFVSVHISNERGSLGQIVLHTNFTVVL